MPKTYSYFSLLLVRSKDPCPLWDYFRSIGTVTMGNLGKSISGGEVEAPITNKYGFVTDFSRSTGSTLFKFIGIPNK